MQTDHWVLHMMNLMLKRGARAWCKCTCNTSRRPGALVGRVLYSCTWNWGGKVLYSCIWNWGGRVLYSCTWNWSGRVLYSCTWNWGGRVLYSCIWNWGGRVLYICDSGVFTCRALHYCNHLNVKHPSSYHVSRGWVLSAFFYCFLPTTSNFNDRWHPRKRQSHFHLSFATDNHILMYKTYKIIADTNEYDISVQLFVSDTAQSFKGRL
jgi:hypothetical protein